MEPDLKKIEHVLGLFGERDIALQAFNQKIGLALAPTFLAAIYALLDMDPLGDFIDWTGFDILGSIAVATCDVVYDPSQPMSDALKHYVRHSAQPMDPVIIQQQLRFGLPIEMMFASVATIVDFFEASIQSELVDSVTKPDDNTESPFDMKTLTKEQLQQLLYTAQQLPGIRQ